MKKSLPKPIRLNEEQQAVVAARNGIYAVYAGPGSGKTSTCVERIVSLIQEGSSVDDILALSFTVSGAKNLRTKIEAKTGPWSIKRTASGSMTLHSLALKFAESERGEFPYELAEFPLATELVANKLSAEAARRYEIDPRHLRSSTSLFKRTRIRPGQAIKSAELSGKTAEIKLALAYKDLDKRMRDTGTMDFDSLMFEMVELLDKNSAVRDRWQYQFVICDEAQDCCKTDWQLLRLLSEKHGNLMCVGDPGQSIFGFRGADLDTFLNLECLFPGVQKLFLAANHRSSPEIVGFLKGIGPVPELAEKFHTQNPSGPVPVIRGFTTSADEVQWVVDQIKVGA